MSPSMIFFRMQSCCLAHSMEEGGEGLLQAPAPPPPPSPGTGSAEREGWGAAEDLGLLSFSVCVCVCALLLLPWIRLFHVMKMSFKKGNK